MQRPACRRRLRWHGESGYRARSQCVAAGTSVLTSADEGTPLKKSPPLVYRVKRGDTLARIAQHHHCSVKQLQAWNGLKTSSRLKLGQVLHVASPETVRAVNAANAAANAAAKLQPPLQSLLRPR